MFLFWIRIADLDGLADRAFEMRAASSRGTNEGIQECAFHKSRAAIRPVWGSHTRLCGRLRKQRSADNLRAPENAVYVFGPEDGKVPQVIRGLCHRFVHIPAHFCLNLSAAVNVVLSHRLMSRQLSGVEPLLPLREMLHEVRGEVLTPSTDAVGWDGK